MVSSRDGAWKALDEHVLISTLTTDASPTEKAAAIAAQAASLDGSDVATVMVVAI